MYTQNNEIYSTVSREKFITDFVIALYNQFPNDILCMPVDFIKSALTKRVNIGNFGHKVFICPDLTAGENVSNIGKKFSPEILKINLNCCLKGMKMMGSYTLPNFYIFVIQISEDQYCALTFKDGQIFYLNPSNDQKATDYDNCITEAITREYRVHYPNTLVNWYAITKEKLLQQKSNDYVMTVCSFLEYFLGEKNPSETSLCRFLKLRMMNSVITQNAQNEMVKSYLEFRTLFAKSNMREIVEPLNAPNKKIRLNSGHSVTTTTTSSAPFSSAPSFVQASSVNQTGNILHTTSAIRTDCGTSKETSQLSSTEKNLLGNVVVDNVNKMPHSTPILPVGQTQTQGNNANLLQEGVQDFGNYVIVDKTTYNSMIVDKIKLHMTVLINQFEQLNLPIYQLPLQEMLKKPSVVQPIIQRIDEIFSNFMKMTKYPKEIFVSTMSDKKNNQGKTTVEINDRTLLELRVKVYENIRTLWCAGYNITYFAIGVTKNNDFKLKVDEILTDLFYLRCCYEKLLKQSALTEASYLTQASGNRRSTSVALETAVRKSSVQQSSFKQTINPSNVSSKVIYDLKNSLEQFNPSNKKFPSSPTAPAVMSKNPSTRQSTERTTQPTVEKLGVTPSPVVPAVMTKKTSTQQLTEELTQPTQGQAVDNSPSSTSLSCEDSLLEAEQFLLNDKEAKFFDQEIIPNSQILPPSQFADAVETNATLHTSDTVSDGFDETSRKAHFAENDSFAALLLTLQEAANTNRISAEKESPVAPCVSPQVTNPISSEIAKKGESNEIGKTFLAVHDDDLLYLDEQIQSLLRIMINQPNVNIMAAQSPNLNSEFKSMFAEVLLKAINNAKDHQTTTVIPLNTVRQAALDTNGLSQNAGDHWIAVSVRSSEGSVLIKFIDPLGSVSQISTITIDEQKYSLPGGKVEVDYKINNALFRFTKPRKLILNKNAEDFLELLKKDVVPYLRLTYRDFNLQVVITGMIQQTNSVDCGAYIVKDLVDEALGQPLTKESAKVLRQQHEVLLGTQLDNADSHQSYTRSL